MEHPESQRVAASTDATRLLQVERDGNPLRRYGHASPFTGKLAPMDAPALHALANLVRLALPPLPGMTLAIGMTESSLLLSWFVAWHQQPPVDLRFTTREQRGKIEGRTFSEPHSHGPQHFLSLDPARAYDQILVIEDELTTGATLSNLIRAVRDIASRVWVMTLRDLRPPELKQALQDEMQREGVRLEILDLSALAPSLPQPQVLVEPPLLRFNPFGRHENIRREALDALQREWRQFGPCDLYLIGECVDLALEFWSRLPLSERPQVRQITRSPWKVDGGAVLSRQPFEGDGVCSRYFLYNWQPPKSGRAILIGEAATRCISEQAQAFLSTQNVSSHAIEVPS
jgi:hypothetical protein